MSLSEKYQQQVATFVKVCQKLASNIYVTAHGGNLAWKLEDNLILITPTKTYKGDITPEDVVFIDMAGETVEGKHKPTGEKPMYINFFRERPDVNAVIHCHPPYACASAIMADSSFLMRPFFPETTTEVGPVPVVPYAQPLTQELADNFLPYLQKYDTFIMENHGLVTMTPGDIHRALMNIELIELSIQSIIAALSAGSLKEIDRKGVEDLDNVMKIRNLPLFGAPGVNESLIDLYF